MGLNIEKLIGDKSILIKSLEKEINRTEAIEQFAKEMESKFETFETNLGAQHLTIMCIT